MTSDYTAIFFTVYAFLIGLCFGSFANVLIYRLPRGESFISPPSHCPKCGKGLTGRDLVPILSRILLKGRCRFCGEKISFRYTVVEGVCGILFACTAVYTGLHLSVIPLCILSFVLLCVFFIDMDTQEIPDGLLITGAVSGILWITASFFAPLGAPVWHDALLGALCGSAPLFIINCLTILLIKQDGFGFGDVKLMAMAGLFLGWRLALASLFFAVVSGGLFASFLLLSGRAKRGTYMAFGPFLAIAVLTSLWFGNNWIR